MLKKLKSLGGNLSRWEIQITIAGTRTHRTFVGTQQVASEIYAKYADNKARAGMGLASRADLTRKPLAEAVREYEAHLRTLQRSDEHVEDVGYTLAGLKTQLGPDKFIAEITRGDLYQWREWRAKQMYRKRRPSPRTLNKALAEVSGFLGWCEHNDWCENNVAAKVARVTETEKPPPAPAWEEFCALADNLWKTRPEMALLVEAIADSGARIDELLSAVPADVDAARGIWRKHVKGNRIVEVRAEPWILHALKHAGKRLFVENGEPWKYDRLYRVLKRRCKQLGLPRLRPHVLRHGRATWDVETGKTPREVQEKLSHTTLQITQQYFKGARALMTDKNAVRTRQPGDFCVLCGFNRALDNVQLRRNAVSRNSAKSGGKLNSRGKIKGKSKSPMKSGS